MSATDHSSLSSLKESKDTPSSTVGFQTCTEQPDEVSVKVDGRLPAWLSGTLYRTGPGQYEITGSGTNEETKKQFNIEHWFDGRTLNHRFAIDGADNSVRYRSRLACSELLAVDQKAGKATSVTFGQPHDPCERLFTKFQMAFKTLRQMGTLPESKSNGNVGVTLDFDHRSKLSTSAPLLARTDANQLQKLDPVTLEPIETLSYGSFHKGLAKGSLAAAHPAITVDGWRYNYVILFGGPFPRYRVFGIDPQGKTKILTTFTGAPAAYLHSLAATENYVVLTIWQADIKALGLSIPWNNNILQSIARWDPKRKTIHYVINRHTGKIRAKIQSSCAYFCFHHINAFERRDEKGEEQVVLDLATYPDTSIMDYLKLDELRSFDSQDACSPSYERVTLSLDARTAQSNVAGLFIELPTIHPDLRWRKARYTYGIHHSGAPGSRRVFVDGVVKVDMDHAALQGARATAKQTDNHIRKMQRESAGKSPLSLGATVWSEHGLVPGEPIFVPRPGSEQEDDGVLLTVVLDVLTQKSELICLDARSMSVVARAKMESIVPFGFHGMYAGGDPVSSDASPKAVL